MYIYYFFRKTAGIVCIVVSLLMLVGGIVCLILMCVGINLMIRHISRRCSCLGKA